MLSNQTHPEPLRVTIGIFLSFQEYTFLLKHFSFRNQEILRKTKLRTVTTKKGVGGRCPAELGSTQVTFTFLLTRSTPVVNVKTRQKTSAFFASLRESSLYPQFRLQDGPGGRNATSQILNQKILNGSAFS